IFQVVPGVEDLPLHGHVVAVNALRHLASDGDPEAVHRNPAVRVRRRRFQRRPEPVPQASSGVSPTVTVSFPPPGHPAKTSSDGRSSSSPVPKPRTSPASHPASSTLAASTANVLLTIQWSATTKNMTVGASRAGNLSVTASHVNPVTLAGCLPRNPRQLPGGWRSSAGS